VTEALAHDRAFEQLELVALGAAAPDVTAGVLAHAAECGECRSELDELTLLLAALTVLIPDLELNRGRSAGIRSRLMARADADADAAAKRRVAAAARSKEMAGAGAMHALPGWERMARGVPERPTGEQVLRPTPRAVPHAPSHLPASSEAGLRSGLLWTIIATVALLGAVGAAMMLRSDGEVTPEPGMNAHVAELEARVDSLEEALAASERREDVVTGRAVRVVDLVSFASAGRPLARVFWDTESNRWTLFVYELRPSRADHIYQLWAQTTQGRISAGTFLSASDGTARMEASLPVGAAAVRSIFITEEPSPGSPQPTGRPVAAGAL
jgi:hypothetical protein